MYRCMTPRAALMLHFIPSLFHALLMLYRVGHLLADLGWFDLDLECSTIVLGQ